MGSGEAEVHCVVVVTVTLHTEIHGHGGGDLHGVEGVTGDVDWPGARPSLEETTQIWIIGVELEHLPWLRA